ncbi:putative defensin-like protein 244 [Rhodamnia argentea]|uniref:Defensin-like protein 244 n=1 Tax=Rhodamnia argentea TaxID=178133 RepID=A0ABM3H7J1_9MYRT|nr:putative defensin-like protein 244 [Rhodamnia argentea]
MRKSVLLSVLALVLVSNLADLSRGDLKFCRKEKTYDGACGDDGSFQCALKFLNDFGARAMPQKCICTTQRTSQQLCNCLVVCREEDVPAKPNA